MELIPDSGREFAYAYSPCHTGLYTPAITPQPPSDTDEIGSTSP